MNKNDKVTLYNMTIVHFIVLNHLAQVYKVSSPIQQQYWQTRTAPVFSLQVKQFTYDHSVYLGGKRSTD